MFRRSFPVIAGVIALFFALTGIASAKQYVLKHPHERCKAHYVKKTKFVRKHQHGRIVKVRETLCVYVAPAPAEAPTPVAPAPVVPTPTGVAPAPTAPTPPEPVKTPPKEEPKPIATITKLEASKPEECSQVFVLGGESENCYFELFVSVSSITGEALSSPASTFAFTNEGEPGKVWTFNSRGLPTFWIGVTNESNSGLAIEETFLSQPHELLAKAHGLKPWKVHASYPGTSKYAASQSSTLSLALH